MPPEPIVPPESSADTAALERILRSAMTMHREGRLSEAEDGYRAVLAAAPNEFDASHLLGLLYLQQDRAEEAAEFLQRAVELRPDSIEALSNLGAALFVLRRFEEALDNCNRILVQQPGNVGMLFNRGAAELALERYEAAIKSFDRVLVLSPSLVPAMFGRANALAELGRDQEALNALNALITVSPQHADALTRQGQVLARLGLHDAALASYDRAVAAQPENLEALEHLGAALASLKRREEAMATFDRLLALAPDYGVALQWRAELLRELGNSDVGLAVYDRLRKLQAFDADLHAGRARALLALGRFEEALAASDEALAEDPASTAACLCRGDALRALDRIDEAIAAYEQVLAVNPDHPNAFGALGECHLSICNWDKVADFGNRVGRRIEEGSAVVRPSALLLLDTTPMQQLEWTQAYAASEFPVVPPLAAQPRKLPDKMRVAYLSAAFDRDGSGHALADLIERHDRERFEIIGISFGPPMRGDLGARLAAAFDQLHEVRSAGTLGIAQLVHKLQATIVVDLMGYGVGARPDILVHRPAPIQVGYLGYPGTIGCDVLDYLIADAVALPEALEPYFTEQIVRVPGCHLASDTRSAGDDKKRARDDAGLPARNFVFCCFANHANISKLMFDLWMRLLNAVKGSVLWLAPDQGGGSAQLAAQNLRRAARTRGVDPDRLVFAAPASSFAEQLARHRLADLFLDTAPCGSQWAAVNALWAGLPVLTCSGHTFASRTTASALLAAGLPALLTESLRDYEILALKLAKDIALLHSLQRRLADHNARVTLFDAELYRRQIEAAYLRMWKIYQSGVPPYSFVVNAK